MKFKTPKSLLVLILFFSICLLQLACNNQNEQKFQKTIGVSLLTRGHIFYRDLEEGLNNESDKYGYKLIITSAEWDLGKQLSQIEDFISRKVDAIVVCPVDSKGIGSGIAEANNAGIPVFTADIAAEKGNVVSHIASDNVQGGRLAGEYLAKLLNGKGNVAIINQPAITSVLDRVSGFNEAIIKYPEIKIAADVNGQGVRDRSLQVTADVLQANPRLDGIFGINDDSALGALDAVNQFDRKEVVIIGYDATPPAVDAILKDAQLKADVVQYPKEIGIKTIDIISDYFNKKNVPKFVSVEVGIVDKESLKNQSTTK